MTSPWTSADSFGASSSSSLVHPKPSSLYMQVRTTEDTSLSSIPEVESSSHAICDECEHLEAAFFCVDCDLVYCDACNALRHRKGNLRKHLRQQLGVKPTLIPTPHAVANADASVRMNSARDFDGGTGGIIAMSPLSLSSSSSSSTSSPASSSAVVNPRYTKLTSQRVESDSDTAIDPLNWSVDEVKQWMQTHELEAFLDEVDQHQIDGQFLFTSLKMNHFLDNVSSGNRGLKKKLVREIHKVKSQMTAAVESESDDKTKAIPSITATTIDPSASDMPTVSMTEDVPSEITFSDTSGLSSSRHPGVNLRVQVDGHAAVERLSSPVTALRSRITHGQVDETKGRVSRRMTSSGSGTGIAMGMGIPPLQIESNAVVHAKRSKSFAMRPTLKIQIDPQETPTDSVAAPAAAGVDAGGIDGDKARNDLRSARNALGALDLNITQVKKEARAVAASFDFTAEGRLQTQGFDINTQGITTTPFTNLVRPPAPPPSSSALSTPPAPAVIEGAASTSSNQPRLGTKEYLIILKELGHGAGGKVYKALYVPTMKLVAVKVIRIYDQKKRHQMVRELRSLYANFVSICESEPKAACEELVIFYDAYTNPEIGSVSIVLEYMDHGSLEDLVQSKHKCSEKELANIAYGVLKGLAFLHEHHQLHRDIKLSNILINRKNKVKISDFGISRDLESTLAKATTFTGTLLYMAPERISGGMYSYPSDIWSFGLALMACAIGQLPVPTKDGYWGVVQAVQEQPSPQLSDYGSFSPSLCEFLDLCLQKNPMMRPPAVRLLEHRFLKEHLVDLEPVMPSAQQTAEQLDELDQIATQLAEWYTRHADDPQYIAQQPVWTMTRHDRLASLAQQLHVPLETVVSKLKFLEKYADEAS